MTKNQIDYWRLEEDKRHNRATERETNRANVEREVEQARTNLANEGIKATANMINSRHYQNQDALTRDANAIKRESNVLTRQIESERQELTKSQILTNAEIAREQMLSNQRVAQTSAGVGYAQVGLGYSQLSEQTRSALANESIREESNAINRLDAGTRRLSYSLESTKWNQSGYGEQRARTGLLNAQMQTEASKSELNQQQSQTEVAKRQRMQVQNVNDSINTGANVANALSNAVGAAGRLINPLKGILGQ